MVAIQQYESKVGVSNTPIGYNTTKATPDAFGASIAQANVKLGEVMSNISNNMLQIKEQIDKTNANALGNYIDKVANEKLHDPKNGYFAKLGYDAMANPEDPTKGSQAVISDIEKEVRDRQAKLGLNYGYGSQMAELMISRKMGSIYEAAGKHELDQTRKYAEITSLETQNIALQRGVNGRNNPEEIKTALGNLKVGVLMSSQLAGYDQETTKINLAKAESQFYGGILNAYLQENSLKATDFYEEHKDKFLPEEQAKYFGAVKDNENRYIARDVSDRLFNLYPEDEEKAYAEVDKIQNEVERAAIETRLNAKYSRQRRLKEQEQSDMIDTFYNSALEKYKKGEIVTEDDIPVGLDGQNYFKVKNSLDNFNSTGDVKTDLDTETYLWNTANNDADRFKGMNLAIYKMSLSKDDYNALLKRQQDIQKGDYFSVIKNTTETQNYIEAVTGIGNKDELLYNEYQGMVRALEQKKGRTATNVEKESILKYLGTNKDAYKLLESGVREQVGFYKNIANKISYYSSRHNGEMPPEKEVYQWLKEDTLYYYRNKYKKMQETVYKAIPRKGETKTLAYLADTVTPRIGKELGLNIKVTSRFRPSNGVYISHHAEGTALDISMSEHNAKDRLKIVEEYLKEPSIKAIGTSDINIIRKYSNTGKIVDERAFDKQYGTNHTNHIHITTINDGTQIKNNNDVITLKNQLKNKGYSDTQIANYSKKRGF